MCALKMLTTLNLELRCALRNTTNIIFYSPASGRQNIKYKIEKYYNNNCYVKLVRFSFLFSLFDTDFIFRWIKIIKRLVIFYALQYQYVGKVQLLQCSFNKISRSRSSLVGMWTNFPARRRSRQFNRAPRFRDVTAGSACRRFGSSFIEGLTRGGRAADGAPAAALNMHELDERAKLTLLAGGSSRTSRRHEYSIDTNRWRNRGDYRPTIDRDRSCAHAFDCSSASLANDNVLTSRSKRPQQLRPTRTTRTYGPYMWPACSAYWPLKQHDRQDAVFNVL